MKTIVIIAIITLAAFHFPFISLQSHFTKLVKLPSLCGLVKNIISSVFAIMYFTKRSNVILCTDFTQRRCNVIHIM